MLRPFVLDTCVRAAEWAAHERTELWHELLDELGEDGDDVAAVVRATEWEVPLRLDADVLVLAAIGDAPLLEVEAEGLPLALLRAAEAESRDAGRLMTLLRAEGLEPGEVLAVLGRLPVQQDTVEEVGLLLEADELHRQGY